MIAQNALACLVDLMIHGFLDLPIIFRDKRVWTWLVASVCVCVCENRIFCTTGMMENTINWDINTQEDKQLIKLDTERIGWKE